jgi:hypothetical protein
MEIQFAKMTVEGDQRNKRGVMRDGGIDEKDESLSRMNKMFSFL